MNIFTLTQCKILFISCFITITFDLGVLLILNIFLLLSCRSNSISGDESKEKPFQDLEDSCSTEPASEKTYRELSRLLMLQFTVEQLAIEVIRIIVEL